jgi:Tfp pilus assembly protein PilO
MIVAGAVALVVALVFFFFFVRPRRSELGEVRAEIEAAQNEQQTLQQQLQVLEELRDNAPELQAELDEIRGFVPAEPEVPNFIFQVQEEANRSGVDFVQVTPELPKQPPEGAEVAEVRTAIRAGGGYFAIQDFVRRLYELDRALRIDLFALEAQEAGEEAAAAAGETRVELSATARIFFELPEGVAAGAAPAEAPAAPASPAPASPAPASPAPASPEAAPPSP